MKFTKIMSLALASIMTLSIGVQASAKTTNNENIQVYSYDFGTEIISVEKDTEKGIVTVKKNNEVVETKSMSDYEKEMKSLTKVRDKSEKASPKTPSASGEVSINYVVDPGDGGYPVRTGGDPDTNYYSVSSSGPYLIQVVSWAYDDVYGTNWKYAQNQGSNIGYLLDFVLACDSWTSSRNQLIVAGIAAPIIAAFSYYYGAASKEKVAQIFAWFGYGGDAPAFANAAYNMMVDAQKMRTAFNSVTATYSGSEVH